MAKGRRLGSVLCSFGELAGGQGWMVYVHQRTRDADGQHWNTLRGAITVRGGREAALTVARNAEAGKVAFPAEWHMDPIPPKTEG